MKRSALALTFATAVLLAVPGTRALLSTHGVATDGNRLLSAWAGRPLRLTGEQEFRAFPLPHIHWTTVTVSEGATEVLRAEAIDTYLDLAALIVGRPRVGRTVLKNPRVVVAAASVADRARRPVDLLARMIPARFDIEDGTLVLRRPDGTSDIIENITGSFAWPRAGADLTMEARFTRRGEVASFRLAAPAPDRLIGAESGSLDGRLDLPGFRAEFSGHGGLAGVDGVFSADLSEPKRFTAWSDIPQDPGLIDGPIRLGGSLSTRDATATLSAARLDLAGDRAEGAVSLRWDTPQPQIGATLAFGALDLTRSSPPDAFGTGWRILPLGGDRPPFDLDLRLSAASVATPAFTMRNVAAALNLAAGTIHAEIGNADLWSSSGSVVLRGTLDGRGLHAQVRANAPDLDVSEAATAFGVAGVTAGRAEVALEGSLDCLRLGECVDATRARVEVAVRKLTMTGPSPFGDVTRFHPIAVAIGAPPKSSTWSRADASLRLAGPRLTVDRMEIEGATMSFRLEGVGDLETGAVDLDGIARFPAFRAGSGAAASAPVDLPIHVGGSVHRLVTSVRTPDPSSNTATTPPAH